MTTPSAEDIYAAMGQSMEGESGNMLRKKFKACVVFQIEGETWSLDVKNGTLSKEPSENADLTVTVSLDVLQQLLSRKLTPQQAFMKGKLKIKGNMGLAMKLTAVLTATTKCLPRSKL